MTITSTAATSRPTPGSVTGATVPVPTTGPASETDQRSVCVVIPMPNDPPWELFDEVPAHIPIIVSDDSNGQLAPPPRENVWYFDSAAQQAYTGEHFAAMPHRSAASRNVGHYIAYREGFDVIVALDYDCGTRPGWLAEHLRALGTATGAPALQPGLERGWVNSIDQVFGGLPADGPNAGQGAGSPVYARGYPYELRTPELSRTTATTVSGEVKLNMGVWDGILDLNGIDKLFGGEPGDPGLAAGPNQVALGNLPLCGMNTAFAAELTPAYFFLPDVWVDGWQLSRHDDIWGGYIVKRLMDLRGDLLSFGGPVVQHTKQTRLERVVVLEQWMHLMSMPFYDLVEEALTDVESGEYLDMYAAFVDGYHRALSRSTQPAHYRAVFAELGDWMARWSRAFR
ncbi:hypothetical protein [Nakamurella leprariae]|uniref:Glycosyltransferase n=1 Tax=Nakamurella leprariae TaxID=2803911 RepID=A0A938YFW3_9ACTN|nr:hypothetical protein [Nakamurella leprariae]MBM9469144.1 hypothetical protein [Nakamurella leprariae]